MKKFIVLSIVLLMLAGFATTSSAEELVVGRKHVPVGDLTVEVVGVNLVVTYTITDPEWELGDTHLYVGTIAPTKSAPGQFPYGPEDAVDGVYTILLADFGGAAILYIAAQAEIGMIDEFGDPVLDEDEEQIEETTWAKGEDPICIPPCKNWAMYFEFEVVAP
jgi:hypothetical protein